MDRFPAEVGEQVDLERVLLVVDGEQVSVGAPVVEGARVKATVVAQTKGPKLIVFSLLQTEETYRQSSLSSEIYWLQIDTIAINGKDEER